MAKVYSVHDLELRPGVSAEELERFLIEVMNTGPSIPGMRVYALKGDRGERAGKYAVLLEFDSIERRDQLYPSEGEQSEELTEGPGSESMRAIFERWGTLSSLPGETYTDYVVLGTL